MSPAMVDTFVCACVFLLVCVVGFFGARWVRSTDKLGDAVGALNTTIVGIDKTQAIQAEHISQHREELDELWRRTCQNPDCPYRGDRRKE
jgi:hypothetical protein